MAFEDFINDTPEQVQQEMEESEYKELLNDFFKKKHNIEFKTELTDDELKEINRLLFIADMLDFKELKNFCIKFMELRVSYKRAGRKEFIYSIKPESQVIPIQQLSSPILDNQQQQQSGIRKLFGSNNNNRR